MANMKISEINNILSSEKFCNEILEKFHKFVPLENYEEKDVLVGESVLKDSKNQFIFKCKNCNNFFFTEKSYTLACPHCSTTGKTLNFYHGTQSTFTGNVYGFIQKYNEVFILLLIERKYMIKKFDDDTYLPDKENKYFDNPIIPYDIIKRKYFFSEKLGFRDNNYPRTQPKNAYEFLREINYATFIDNDEKKELFSILGKDSSCNLSENLAKYNNALKKKNKKQVKPINTDDLVSALNTEFFKKRLMQTESLDVLGTITDIFGTEKHYSIKCLCGHVITGVNTEENNNTYRHIINVNTECPNCGRKITQQITDGCGTEKFFVSYAEPVEDGIVKRIFLITNSINEDFNFNEIQRIFLYPKKASNFIKDTSDWKKRKITDIVANGRYGYDFLSSVTSLNTNEEFENMINNSFLSKTGLLQAWGLGEFTDFAVEDIGRISDKSYIIQWYKKPWLEILVKSKLIKLTKEFMTNGYRDVFNKNATDIYDLLGIKKATFKIARQLNLGYSDIYTLKNFHELQPNFSLQDWQNLLQDFDGNTRSINYFADVCKQTNTSVKRLRDYLQSCYDNQCIEKSSALTIFSDYYKMAKDSGFNIQDNSIKFPNSLKKEHDKANFAYKVVQNEIKKKKFVENSNINKKYEFENKLFKVIVPTEPEEVVREGQLQSHCVASYVTRIENGDTCICFIRKKEDIDKPFFTCEIYQEELYQVKGFSNRYPDKKKDIDLISFIDDWTKEKNLTQSYMAH